MTGVEAAEADFIAGVERLRCIEEDLREALRRMDDWHAGLVDILHVGDPDRQGLDPHSAITVQQRTLEATLDACMLAWRQQRAELAPAQALAESFDDRVVLLVFGKVNAGKSSFCNFLAERFAGHGKATRSLHLEGGRIIEEQARLREGATETTSRIQGVLLGDRLVLLDTPGLHSVAEENAQLARRFTDSADGVLWLSSSASPGQVQELDELHRELRRSKPLLPLITRSDVYEEDEIDGRVLRLLRNKTPENRAMQEADVYTRAQEKLRAAGLDAASLRDPVSVSVYMAREPGQGSATLEAAGFARLYAALDAIVRQALAYKRRKSAEIVLHHLEEHELDDLQGQVMPLLADLDTLSATALAGLDERQAQRMASAGRQVTPQLPGLLERHASSGDVAAACRDLSGRILDAFAHALRGVPAECAIKVDPALATIEPAASMAYQAHVVELEGRSEQVGVSYERLRALMEDAAWERLARLAAEATAQCRTSILGVMDDTARLREGIGLQAQRLDALKREIRTMSVA